MNVSFDTAANNYDQTFTHTLIGKAQRNFVYHHFSKILNNSHPESILEINCGTGEDAVWLAQQNFSVTATDVSSKMIEIARNKSQLNHLSFDVVDCNQVAEKYNPDSFDCVFSNFGGLNCLSPSELRLFFKNASKILTSNGQMVLVIMPKNTLWEELYFILKGKFSEAFRRKKKSVIANVDGEKVTTYYYNPDAVSESASEQFMVMNFYPIGFFVPPSYLESFFKNKPRLFSVLNRLEKRISTFSFLSKYADHYLIHLQKK